MKKNLLALILLITAISIDAIEKKHALTYAFDSGGDRFGDRMLGYLQARYVSYLTNTQFLHKPFIFSNQLSIDYDAQPFETYKNRYHRAFNIDNKNAFTSFLTQIQDPSTPPTLYTLQYLPADIFEWETNNHTLLFNHPWHNKEFSTYIQKCAQPIISIPDFTKENMLNVAVHIRTLSGNDTHDTSWRKLPLKHPQRDYYERQINRVYEYNNKRHMHVFIFSDTKDPQELVNHFRNKFQNCDIEFNIQHLINPDLNYTVHDFYAMQKFDVLIATQSNFSMLAAKIGTFDMIIFPIHLRGQYPNFYIDRVQVISNNSAWFPYEMNIVLRD